MNEREPNLVTSGLSGRVTQDGITVEVAIYRLESETGWSLEAINNRGTSTVWDDLFPTDSAAREEFDRTVTTEGIRTFLDNGNVVPFRRGSLSAYAYQRIFDQLALPAMASLENLGKKASINLGAIHSEFSLLPQMGRNYVLGSSSAMSSFP